MAINKSNSPSWVKAVVIITALSFVASVAGLAAIPLFSGGSATTGSQTPTSTVPAPIPGNYGSLVQAAEATFDEASALQQKLNGAPGGADIALWRQAADYYSQALAVQPGDPNVTTDYAIARFYSGDTTGAIQTGEAVASVNTTFAPVFFNLAIFYANLGDKAKAVELLTKVKTMQPDAQLLANTDSVLKQLGQ